MERKLHKVLCLFLACAMFFGVCGGVYAEPSKHDSYFINENFESTEVGKTPDGFEISAGSGSIAVKEEYGGHMLSVRGGEGEYATVKKSFDEISSQVILFSIDFNSGDVKSDGQIIAELKNKDGKIISIQTKDGSIIYTRPYGIQNIIVDNYTVNTTYKIALSIDLTNRSASVNVGGKRVLSEMPLLSETNSVSEFSSYTNTSAEYFIDNIVLQFSREVGAIKLKGNTKATVPNEGKREFLYSASIYDADGNEMYIGLPDLEWKIENYTGDGLSLTDGTGDHSRNLTVDSSAEFGKTIRITAYNDALNVSGSIDVSLEDSKETEIKINGPAKLVYMNDSDNSFQYTAASADQLGMDMGAVTYKWSVSGDTQNKVTVDDNGLVKVGGELEKDKFVEVTATNPDTGVSGSVKIVTLDYGTYLSDEARLNIVKESIDKALEVGKDKWRGTPLLADGVDISTGEPVVWEFPDVYGDEESVNCNMASQAYIHKSMSLLSDLTGDESYKNRVYDIYRYFLNNYQADNGALYWGGHSVINLKNGKVAQSSTERNIHEIKSHDPWWDMLFEADVEKATKAVLGFAPVQVTDWSNLLFTRHGNYSIQPDMESFNNPSLYLENNHELSKSHQDISMSAYALADSLYSMYKYTGNKNAYIWASRFHDRMLQVRFPETRLPVIWYSTAHKAPGTIDPLTNLEPIGRFWEADPMPGYYAWATYGDRAYNGWAQPLVNQGFITEDQMDDIQEAYQLMFTASSNTGLDLMNSVGEYLKPGDEMYDYIMYNALDETAQYIRYAYIPGQVRFKRIWSNGLDMTGFVCERNFYLSSKGAIMTPLAGNSMMLQGYAKAYRLCKDFPELSDGSSQPDGKSQRQRIYECLREMMIDAQLGDIGEGTPGNNMELNLETTATDPKYVSAFIELYKSTGIGGYLDMARQLADNMVDKYYNYGYFVEKNKQNARLSNLYSIVLLDLEATIRGRSDLVPDYRINSSTYFQSPLKDDRLWTTSKQNDFDTIYAWSDESVKVKNMKLDKNKVTVKNGSTTPVSIKFIPDDASDKSVIWFSSNMSVATVDDKNNIIAHSKGEAELTCYSISNSKVKQKVKVKVTD